MPAPTPDPSARRQFVKFLAASPILAATDRDLLVRLLARGAPADDALQQAAQQPTLITAPDQALNVFDFEPVAQKNIPPAHWGYLVTGSDDDGTVRANREGFTRYELRVRRLIDVSKVDASTQVLGARWEPPIFLAPISSMRAFHRDGELAVARAAQARNAPLVLSTLTTTSVEDVTAARGAPVWLQLYHMADWNQTRQIVKRAERAGCPAVVFTVDLLGGSNRETMHRDARNDTRTCTACHAVRPSPGSGRLDNRDNRRKPMLQFEPGAAAPEAGTPTWEFVKRLRDSTSMRVLLKGIVTKEDAALAMEHGVSGIIVSNHGGRAENSLRPTIACVAEVAAAVGNRGAVLVDGGFRRGTDVFKALALGAQGVGIGRPYVWGLGAFGQAGVEAVLAILRRELELVMRQAGTVSVSRITGEYVVRSGT